MHITTKLSSDERSDISRALAKAIAYRDCGKTAEMEHWAAKLVHLLGASDILDAGRLELRRAV